ncbi:MAG: methyltransferase [Clostridia bacterium]|nr:methyltransferase [Clostridia bacterium]
MVYSKISEKLTIAEYENGLRLGTDAVLLAGFAGKGAKRVGVELGCGSGVISLMLLSENRAAKLTGVEIQPKYASLASENAEKNGLSERFGCINADVREISKHLESGRADIVLCNPPYYRVGSGKHSDSTEADIARRELFGTIDDFCAAASYLLKYGGKFYTVFPPERLCTLICSLGKYKLEPKKIEIITHKGVPTLSLVQSEKNAAEGVKLSFKETSPVHSYDL